MIKKLAKKYNYNYPKNDIEAYNLYPKYNFVYDKLFIAKYQNLKCGPIPIEPSHFPIVIKPIYNLCGMGLNSAKIENIADFNKYLDSGRFWVEYLRGKHYSIDLIVNNGKIIYYTAFEGIIKTFGTFNEWRQSDIVLPKIIKKFIKEKLIGFTGSVNIETIDGKMIEVHLRCGDIDFCGEDIVLLVLMNINNKNIKNQLKLVKNKKHNKVYLVPIWQKLNPKINLSKIYEFIEETIEDKIINDDKIIGYYLDNIDHPNPPNYKRWLLLISHDYEHLIKLRALYTKQINNKEIN